VQAAAARGAIRSGEHAMDLKQLGAVSEALSKRPKSGELSADVVRLLQGMERDSSKARWSNMMSGLRNRAPFRDTGKSRDEQLADIVKTARLMAASRRTGKGGPPSHPSSSSSCLPGWTNIASVGSTFDFGSEEVNPAKIGEPGPGIAAFSQVGIPDPLRGAISMGVGLGSYCDVTFVANDESLNLLTGSHATASLSKIIPVETLAQLAPDALMVSASVLAPSVKLAMQSIGRSIGVSWACGQATLDVTLVKPGYIPSNIAELPHFWAWNTATMFVEASPLDALWATTDSQNDSDVTFLPVGPANINGGNPTSLNVTIPRPIDGVTGIYATVSVDISLFMPDGQNAVGLIDATGNGHSNPVLLYEPALIDSSAGTMPVLVQDVCVCGI
jgi:hypothetical protein